MDRSSPPAVLPLVLALLVGCTSSGPPSAGVSATGSMRLLLIPRPDALPSDVARVTITVSASDMAPISTRLAVTDGTWGGVISDIPAGPHRTFLAQAFTSSDSLRYEGRAEDVTVTTGATGLLSLTLQEVFPSTPFTNEAPIVDSLVATPTAVTPGGSVSLTSRVHDPNPGDSVSYLWSAASGGFSAPTQASTTWSAPTTQGPVALTLTVSDSHGASVTLGLTVTVSAGSGADAVTVAFNTAPTVVALTSSQCLLEVGQQTALSVSATDPDGDSLGYQWSATCAGSFTGATSANATFTPSAWPSGACNNCQLSVVVKDGRGGQNTGRLAVCVSGDVRHAPPAITRSFQSSPTARAGQQLTFEVGAQDPEGSALSFAWVASVGTLGTASTDATSSRIPWTAPVCLRVGSTPSLTATVTNAHGLQRTRGFTVAGPPACPTVAGWSLTDSMATPRSAHTATLLPNGRVLVAGGANAYYVSPLVTQTYDPTTERWSTTGAMSTGRAWAAAALTQGKVLISGGYDGPLLTAEVYDPATDTWNPTGSMGMARSRHTLVTLASGKVLITGESYRTEAYDPATGTWGPARDLVASRVNHAATLLPDGRVLLSGGVSGVGVVSAEAQLYDPATDTWSPTGSLSTPRASHVSTLLANGKVLVVGGQSVWNDDSYLATAEVYDPATGSWSPTGSMATARRLHTATRLSTGKVLVVGGTDNFYGNSYLASTELYDPATGTWSSAGSLATGRYSHTATLLPTGKVLVTGGAGNHTVLGTAELYDPGTSP